MRSRRTPGYHVFTNLFVGMSGEMVPISMIVYKNQYYTVMVLDSQACSPRIITNLYSQARYMATTTHTST